MVVVGTVVGVTINGDGKNVGITTVGRYVGLDDGISDVMIPLGLLLLGLDDGESDVTTTDGRCAVGVG